MKRPEIYQNKIIYDFTKDDKAIIRCIIDYLSGMSDEYIIKIFNELISFQFLYLNSNHKYVKLMTNEGVKILPIKIPNDLPASKILKDENIFVMDENRALTQQIRPLKL